MDRFFFDGHLDGARYLQFLTDELPILLEEVPLNVRMDMWYQHDGCPAHYCQDVRTYLNVRFPDRWIGRGSLVPWPPRSPDLTCLDFYLWGRVKNLVFNNRPTTAEDMKERIRIAVRSISSAEIELAVESTRERLDLCINNDGKHFEHL